MLIFVIPYLCTCTGAKTKKAKPRVLQLLRGLVVFDVNCILKNSKKFAVNPSEAVYYMVNLFFAFSQRFPELKHKKITKTSSLAYAFAVFSSDLFADATGPFQRSHKSAAWRQSADRQWNWSMHKCCWSFAAGNGSWIANRCVLRLNWTLCDKQNLPSIEMCWICKSCKTRKNAITLNVSYHWLHWRTCCTGKCRWLIRTCVR